MITGGDPGRNHEFQVPLPGYSRSPCPGLNTLANHGFVSRSGKRLTFTQVVNAVQFVYNISYPLAIFLTFIGFLTCARFTWSHRSFDKSQSNQPTYIRVAVFLMSLFLYCLPSWTLDLSALSARGTFKITHNGAFVHPDGIPSTTPDRQMLEHLIDYAPKTQDIHGRLFAGLNLLDLARYHAMRKSESPRKLGSIHNRIALGEVALLWYALRGSVPLKGYPKANIPIERINRFLGEERLPEGWWDPQGVRPALTISLSKTRQIEKIVQTLGAIGA